MSPSSARGPTSPYRWAIGAPQVTPGQTIGDRYVAVTARIWRDTRPHDPPPALSAPLRAALGKRLRPYRRLQSTDYALVQHHLPGLEAVVGARTPVLLLSGSLDATGQLYPPLHQLWPQAEPLQQLSWLWQLCPLWEALSAEGVAASLLQRENLRVDGDRLCLLALVPDGESPPTVADLGQLWLPWTIYAGSLAAPLQKMAQQLQGATQPEALYDVEYQLNQLLLQAAQLAAAPSPQPPTSPITTDSATQGQAAAYDSGESLLAAVCAPEDGSKSSELSHTVVQSLVLQTTAMARELARCGPLSPRWIAPQILAMVRVIRNLLQSQGDSLPPVAFALGLTSLPWQDTTAAESEPSPSALREVYLFTTTSCCIYWRQGARWQRFATINSVPLEREDAREATEHNLECQLDGAQLRRLVMARGEQLLLSTCPLEDYLKGDRLTGDIDLAEVRSWIAAHGGTGAIALVTHQSQPAEAVVEPSPVSDIAPPLIPSKQPLEPQPSLRPEVIEPITEPTEADSPAPSAIPIDALFQELENPAAEATMPEASERLDSVSTYINADVQQPRPGANTISDRDIEQGLFSLVTPEPLEAPDAPEELPAASEAPKPQRQVQKWFSRLKRPKRPQLPTPSKRPKQLRRKPRKKQRRRPRNWGNIGLILVLIILLLAAGGIVGTIIWQQRTQDVESE